MAFALKHSISVPERFVQMARLKLSVRSTETYTEPNFLRLQTQRTPSDRQPMVTIEHLWCRATGGRLADQRWICTTIVDAERMSKEDALFIAKAYATENGIPVIYECHCE